LLWHLCTLFWSLSCSVVASTKSPRKVFWHCTICVLKNKQYNVCKNLKRVDFLSLI
jgi:hypothetical protein